MSSQTRSATQGSDSTSSPKSPTTHHSPPPFTSYRDLTGNEIYKDLQDLDSKGIHYAVDKKVSLHSEFIYNKDIKGDILVPKNTKNDLSEYILAGIFEIDGRNFFMTSDGKWSSTNPIGTHLHQVKPSCHLLPVQRDTEFNYSSNDFPSIINNLHAIENIANSRKSRDVTSVVVGDSGHPTAIKLTHHLFTEKKNPLDTDNDDLSFKIDNWPVSSSNEYYLDEIKSTHNVHHIPAYDIRGNLIHPGEYEDKLAGAITRVCFTIVHYLIKQKHVFNAIARDITVLRPPTSITAPKKTIRHILHPEKKLHN